MHSVNTQVTFCVIPTYFGESITARLQVGLNPTLLETQKTGFLVLRHIY